MRRRVDAKVSYNPARVAYPHSCSYPQKMPPPQGVLRICPVPYLWREHAQQPWRVLFPDLDWTPE